MAENGSCPKFYVFCELSEQERSNLVLFEDNVFMGGGRGGFLYQRRGLLIGLRNRICFISKHLP